MTLYPLSVRPLILHSQAKSGEIDNRIKSISGGRQWQM
jgi:hypothetical protein